LRQDELAFVAALTTALAGEATVSTQAAPPWLVRPGRAELGERWELARGVYAALTGLEHPDVVPPRERRQLDVILTHADGSNGVVVFDEDQHFTSERLTTLGFYDDLDVGFDVEQWGSRAVALGHKPRGGGFARPKPPLFPGEGGRHRQRAFRDFLADALPGVHGWRPTVRFMNVELEKLSPDERVDRVRELWLAKTS